MYKSRVPVDRFVPDNFASDMGSPFRELAGLHRLILDRLQPAHRREIAYMVSWVAAGQGDVILERGLVGTPST